ncbi:MAG: (2E,6E)-farnesyl diphosphate synthase [Gammaproteobacteria bacterium]|nr:(2E,6E)-farnesyl diphosphate synthase [Gammaproteobacteria bacterium]
MNSTDLSKKFNLLADRTESALERWLPSTDTAPQRLHEAMRYASLGGGKRVRPFLVYATGEALGTSLDQLDGAAVAIECIHAYSLVHDDLPAMDDDDLRRGRPTCHIAYDEATAILVGDALQTLAFQVLAEDPKLIADHAFRMRMIKALAQASGSHGMVGGQAIDLQSVGKTLQLHELEDMHSRKTGALIRCAVELGCLGSGVDREDLTQALGTYARAIGLAFQVRDDILDVEGDTAVIGKTQGSDIDRNKPTYPALLGMDRAKQIALELHQQAIDSLVLFDSRADTLRELSAFIVERHK